MEEKKENLRWLSLLSRPGFFVRNHRVLAANTDAILMVTPGEDIRPRILTGLEAYEALEAGCLCLSLDLAEGHSCASVIPMEGGFLFLPEREEDEEELRAFALAALELRMPLNNVLALTEQLLQDAQGSVRDTAAGVNRGLYQMLRILGNMSDAGRMASGFQPELRDISAFFRELFEKISVFGEATGVSITASVPQEQILGLVDAAQLERAVYNLVSNALKFTPKGGSVQLSLTRTGRMLKLTVRDSGTGMGEEILQELFYRYLRQPGLEDSRHGLGLGMALVRRAAANHGGAVLVDQPGESGTRITLTLPIRQENTGQLRSPCFRPDYTGERDHGLVELSDCLPSELYGKN